MVTLIINNACLVRAAVLVYLPRHDPDQGGHDMAHVVSADLAAAVGQPPGESFGPGIEQ